MLFLFLLETHTHTLDNSSTIHLLPTWAPSTITINSSISFVFFLFKCARYHLKKSLIWKPLCRITYWNIISRIVHQMICKGCLRLRMESNFVLTLSCCQIAAVELQKHVQDVVVCCCCCCCCCYVAVVVVPVAVAVATSCFPNPRTLKLSLWEPPCCSNSSSIPMTCFSSWTT